MGARLQCETGRMAVLGGGGCSVVASTPDTTLRVRDYYQDQYSYAYAYSPLPSSLFSLGLGRRLESWS